MEAARYAPTNDPSELVQLALREFIHQQRTVDRQTKRPLGLDRGRFEVPDNFDLPDLEIEKAFYGR
jgi:hypothetical protein